MALLLRPFGPQDELAALCAHEDFRRNGFNFLPAGFDESIPWALWQSRFEHWWRDGNPDMDGIRSAFLAADVDGQLVGRASIRYALDASHAERGGHVGYGVITAFRGRGYATAILRAAVDLAHRDGVGPLLVTCDVNNVASAKVIERCGGVFESLRIHEDGTTSRRYWL